MSYIIKSPDELKDPFLCYCVFRRFIEESGEDYIDCNEGIIENNICGFSFLTWMLGKGYINGEVIDKVLKFGEVVDIQNILKDNKYIFKSSYGETVIGDAKAYSLLAEYVSQFSILRKYLYDSVNNEAYGFENNIFYTDENNVSLACIISDENMIETKLYSLKELDNMTIYEFRHISYKDQFNAMKNITIEEADNIDDKYDLL